MGTNGLEPSTSRLSGVRSNQLSYRPFLKKAGEENRTPDISLEGWGFTTKLHPHGGSDGIWTRDLLRDRQACWPLHHGTNGGWRDRTADILLVRQTLSQLS